LPSITSHAAPEASGTGVDDAKGSGSQVQLLGPALAAPVLAEPVLAAPVAEPPLDEPPLDEPTLADPPPALPRPHADGVAASPAIAMIPKTRAAQRLTSAL
jgi:hypothetical protein